MQTFAQNKYLIYLKKKNNIKKLILYLHPQNVTIIEKK
jgi:hypothetical protein